MGYIEVIEKAKREEQETVNASGMVYAKTVHDRKPGEKGLYIYAQGKMRHVDAVTPECWVITAAGTWHQRSYCCHWGEKLYRKD